MPVIYSFEAKSIQSYILESSKLRDMVGASEQIEDITAGLLDQVLNALNLQNEIQFSRKAGGAFIAILNNLKQAQDLRDLWTFTIRYSLPGLEFVQGLHEDKNILEAEKTASDQKRADRNRLFPVFPIAGPLVARSPRTGEPAITEQRSQRSEGLERLDKRTKLKRDFMKRAKNTGLALENKLKLAGYDDIIWPKNLEQEDNQDNEQHFPLLDHNRYIGIIHADGNGLGELLMRVREGIQKSPKYYAEVFRTLSETIEKATVEAAKQAVKQILLPNVVESKNALHVMPARPLVLGGDDLTMIVRGDLAIPFTAKFLQAFEEQSEMLLTKLKKKYKQEHKIDLDLPTGLTACAGIAFIKASQPFYMAYHLAESLCKNAKTRSKADKVCTKGRIPSSLAFHRITSSMIDDYQDICDRELKTSAQLLTMNPYAVGKIDPANIPCYIPKLADLEKLQGLLTDEKISYGAVRELLSLLYINRESAERAYKRWRENMQETQPEVLKDFESVLQNLVDTANPNLQILSAEEPARTPLADAIAWKGICRNV